MSSESNINVRDHHFCKLHPKMQVTVICSSPFCGYYRQLCQICALSEQDHKQKFHIKVDTAVRHVQNRVIQIQKSLLILKRQKEQKLKMNPITLPYQIKQKLLNIRQIINEKISMFQKSLQEKYQNQVNLRLYNLQETIKKSLDFLKTQLNEFENGRYSYLQLKRFFVNFEYWEHQRKYYKSYMDQILQKQVINFKEGFDDDNIMRLIVSFEINLKSIFSQNKQDQKRYVSQRPHIFCEEKRELKKYEIVQRHDDEHFTIKPEYLDRGYPKQKYKWEGVPQSLYYPELDCFYILGEGDVPSNAILKYEDGKLNGNKKFNFVGEMFTKRSHFSICQVNGEIFIIGGYNGKQGCMNKCQKMVISQKIRIYLVSSLQQRSACHSVCNYKNKYILKFGGTNIKLNSKQKYRCQHQVKQLYPQIYQIDKQQWRIIRYNMQNHEDKLQFGLWPLIVIPYQTDPNRIVVFGNKALQKKYQSLNDDKRGNQKQKPRFQIKCFFTRNDIEMKINQKYYLANKKYLIFPQMYQNIQKKNKTQVLAKDITKSQTVINLIDIKNQF